MYKKITFIIFIVFSIITINIYGQTSESFKKPKINRVSEAYGYLIGQEISLNLIKKQFPKFDLEVLKAQTSFNLTFGKGKVGMKKYLSDNMGEEEFIKYDDNLTSKLKAYIQEQSFTEEIASSFLLEVEKRAKGDIVSPILETILHFQFYDRPQDEFTYGFTTTFKTSGHPKSKNTNWQIKIPKSYKAEEADRPNVIKKFVNDYGAGSQGILLMVKELPEKISKTEINTFFTDKEMQHSVPEGARFISFTKMTIDNFPGGLLIFEQVAQRLDLKIKIRMLNFNFIKGNKYYSVQCSIFSDKVDANLDLEMKKFLPLYKMIANSIVITDQYK